MVACGVNDTGQRDILAVKPMLEESEEAYLQFFRSLKDRGLKTPKLVISDANTGLISAIRKGFVGGSGARCKVHFMRNILVHASHKKRERFAAELKGIWLAAGKTEARQRADILIGKYKKTFPNAVKCLEEGLEDSLTFL